MMEGDELIEGVEYAPSEGEHYENYQQEATQQQEDFIRKLSQKVREQAQRLQNLEQYRLLCEARIQDLCPSHPLPVQQKHLGAQFESYNQSEGQVGDLQKVIEARERDLYAALKRCEQLEADLDVARKRQGPSFMAAPSLPASIPMGENYSFPSPNNIQGISFEELTEYYSTIYIKFYEVTKDKGNLEQSLRAETLASEEQRTYIEVLRQALETKLKESGLHGLLQKYAHESVDVFAEITNMKQESDYQRQEYHKARNQIIDFEQQITILRENLHKMKQEKQELINGREKVNQDLDRGVQALSMAKQQVQKLESEKQALLDFTDEQIEKEKQLLAEINALREQNQRFLQELKGEKKQAGQNQDELYNDQEMYSEEVINEFEQIKREYEAQIQEMQQNEQNYLDEIQQYKQQEEQYIQILEEHKIQVEDKLNEIQKLSSELETAKEQGKQMIAGKEKELKQLTQKQDALHKDAQEKQKQIDQMQSQVQQIKSIFEEQERDLDYTKKTNQSLEQQVKELKQNIQIQKKELAESKQELETVQDKIQQLNAENESLTSELQGFRSKKDNTQQQIFELNKKLKELQLNSQYQTDDFNQQKQIQSQQIQLLQEEKLKLEEINKEYRNENIQEKSKQLDEVRKLNSIINQQRTENSEMSQKVLELTQNVVSIQEQLSQNLQENTQLKQQIQKLKEQNHQLRQIELELQATRIESEKIQEERNQYFQEIQQIQKSRQNSQHQLIESSQQQEQTNQQILMIESELISSQNKIQKIEQERDDYKRRSDLLESHSKQLEQNTQQQERQLREQALEINSYKAQLEQATQDLDGLAEERSKLIEDIQTLKMQEQRDITAFDYHVQIIERLMKNLNNCISTLQAFASHFSSMTGIKNYSLHFSGGFRELFVRLGEFQICREAKDLDEASYQITEFVKSAVEEIDSFAQKLTEAKSELNMTQQRNQHLEVKLEQISQGDTGMRERERSLKQEIEALREEKKQLFMEKDVLYKREDKLQRELSFIKTEIRNLTIENENLKKTSTSANVEKDKVMYEFKNQMEGIEADQLQCRIFQEKLQILSKEKKQLELFLQKLQTVIPSPDLQRIFGEMIKTRTDLENVERERYKLDSQLLAAEGEMRQLARQPGKDEAAIQIRKQVEKLRENLTNCQAQINIYQKRQKSLEEDLQGVEISERRRVDLYIDNERQVHQLYEELQVKSKENEQLNFSKQDIQSAYNMLLEENRSKEREIQVLKSELSALQALNRQNKQQNQAIIMSARPNKTETLQNKSSRENLQEKKTQFQMPEVRYENQFTTNQPSILEQRLASSKGSEFSFSGGSQQLPRYKANIQKELPDSEYISSTKNLQDKLLQVFFHTGQGQNKQSEERADVIRKCTLTYFIIYKCQINLVKQ